MTESDSAAVSRSWDNYWQSAATSPAYAGPDASPPQLLAFWNDFFSGMKNRLTTLRLLDIASGNGAVIERLFAAFSDDSPDVTCLDISESALHGLQQRFPAAKTLQANAAQIPLESSSIDIITSQFGIEYAGTEAFDEVRRLLRTGGELAVLLHCEHGEIAVQCRRSREAVERMRSAQFIPRCADMFTSGFAMLQGGDKAAYESAGRALAPAIAAMEKIIAEFGQDTANGTLLRLYRDVRNIHGRMQHHDPADVLQWLENMQNEMDAYADRMSFMLDAALSENDFARLREDFRRDGFTERNAGPLIESGKTAAVAWQLLVRK